MNVWPVGFLCLGLMVLLVTTLWLVQRSQGKAGIVDVAWSFGTALCAVLFSASASGDLSRRWMVAAMAVIWGGRLGLSLVRRLRVEGEDGRYKAMKERWGHRTQAMMFGFFQLQATWAVLFALPMLGASLNPRPISWLDGLGAFVFALAIALEWLADHQLALFKADPANKGKVCRIGLWSWSRHPNYFFEWTHWFAYLILAIGSSGVWLSIGGVVVMYLFLTRVTGIPPTEQRAVESRGDAYRDYQSSVSAFFPLPPKKGVSGA